MSTLPIRAPVPAAQLPVPSFTQLVAGLRSMLDLLAEVDRLASKARQRYPFAD